MDVRSMFFRKAQRETGFSSFTTRSSYSVLAVWSWTVPSEGVGRRLGLLSFLALPGRLATGAQTPELEISVLLPL